MISLRLIRPFTYCTTLHKFPEDRVRSKARLQTFRRHLSVGITWKRTVFASTQTWIIQEQPIISLAPRIRFNVTNAVVAEGKTRRFYAAKYKDVSLDWGGSRICAHGTIVAWRV